MQEQGASSLGVFTGFDGGESCAAKAGDADGVRRAVDAVGAAGGRSGSVVIVLGECADYRQVGVWLKANGSDPPTS